MAVLLGGISGIVRTLNLKVQTRRNETHVEFVLQVEVQNVGTLFYIT